MQDSKSAGLRCREVTGTLTVAFAGRRVEDEGELESLLSGSSLDLGEQPECGPGCKEIGISNLC